MTSNKLTVGLIWMQVAMIYGLVAATPPVEFDPIQRYADVLRARAEGNPQVALDLLGELLSATSGTDERLLELQQNLVEEVEQLKSAQVFAKQNEPTREQPETRITVISDPPIAIKGNDKSTDYERTRGEMLTEIDRNWQRPQTVDRVDLAWQPDSGKELRAKLSKIIIPRIQFSGVPISRVIESISALSEEFDPEGEGVNLVFVRGESMDPPVAIHLRRLSLDRILDYVTQAAGFEYDVREDAVFVRLAQGVGSGLETAFFPVSRSTLIRLVGIHSSSAESALNVDPFAPTPTGALSEESALMQFLQRAGVPFTTIEGANLALADGQLIVTQTPRNLERVRNILRRYSEIKQVEIETRFLEVTESDLKEVGFNWMVRAGGQALVDTATGLPLLSPDGDPLQTYRQRYQSSNRALAQPFSPAHGPSELRISRPAQIGGNQANTGDLAIPQGAPALPNSIDLGTDVAGPLASVSGVLGPAEVDLMIRALERRAGNDLLSAPKVTVLSGKTAEITVAQELRYPESFGRIDAQVGRGDSASGSAGVAITAGTPQDFAVRNIGVEMEVTPSVEEDYSISLVLEPRVTEFEGFIEYGGSSVAIASNTTVTVPSGFYQPIFSVRRIRTEVTIWDGATVVMGGLTREQAISIQDKVPLLGDIPLLGRLFRSEGKSKQKRNLLIFVTARLVTPGGAPRHSYSGKEEHEQTYQKTTTQ